MKTADTISRQEVRKEAESNDSQASEQASVRRKKPKYDASRIAAWQYKPGQSGNPGGRPKHDLAADLARACFENNMPALYKAFSKALLRGNGYVFKELADRGYGRLKERIELDGPYADVSEADLKKRMRELEIKLGIPHSEPEEEAPPISGESKPN